MCATNPRLPARRNAHDDRRGADGWPGNPMRLASMPATTTPRMRPAAAAGLRARPDHSNGTPPGRAAADSTPLPRLADGDPPASERRLCRDGRQAPSAAGARGGGGEWHAGPAGSAQPTCPTIGTGECDERPMSWASARPVAMSPPARTRETTPVKARCPAPGRRHGLGQRPESAGVSGGARTPTPSTEHFRARVVGRPEHVPQIACSGHASAWARRTPVAASVPLRSTKDDQANPCGVARLAVSSRSPRTTRQTSTRLTECDIRSLEPNECRIRSHGGGDPHGADSRETSHRQPPCLTTDSGLDAWHAGAGRLPWSRVRQRVANASTAWWHPK
ncbi:hypothetical protein SAMN05444580_12116 [Rhodococcus tukisamuensis]|uniref:Uncharacterized protein n=1 Tax=Rhodococcus tukisamuensis TaxID=168276 RepID=A0A1G7DVX5_9NOCA|nr:hypothetical protein SAMN05444580_12116 [Rhodococcus tukisamuensis]